jgi:hypothetical protein
MKAALLSILTFAFCLFTFALARDAGLFHQFDEA